MENYKFKPSVDETQEFIEIANDFSNPLDLVREAISNSFDAKATNIKLHFDVEETYGERNLKIIIEDNGNGMNSEELKSFFDLGNSTRRNDNAAIGEKGHGTKVYFNSSLIVVETDNGDMFQIASMKDPIKKLHQRIIPEVEVKQEKTKTKKGTKIIITGYNSNRMGKFTHEQLKDYIEWFTKFASFEKFFTNYDNSNLIIELQGLNRTEYEEIIFGHPFPEESESADKLFEKYLVGAPKLYCKRFIKTGHLKDMPDISYQAIFSVEGNKVKLDNNPMIRRQRANNLPGSYTVAERYGLWLCKDYIPVQRKNEWVNYKGSEFIKLHAFFNCQGLKLTANRGSIDNTPSEILFNIQQEVKAIYDEIVTSDDWANLEWLEDETDAYRTSEKEQKDFDRRIKKIKNSNVAVFKGHSFVEPKRESGVYAILLQLQILEPDLFPFYIIDYDTHSGIDVIVKGDNTQPIHTSKLFYVEFKHYLTKDFNHSFKNLYNIVCWDTTIKHNETLKDLSNEERIMQIVPPENDNDYTKYFLDRQGSATKIEVFVLKDFLKEKLGMEFRPRTVADKL